ncbi:polyketide synthase [Gigaspora margarita]|uniref:Polyketide synthase n=1 Tax=Gigaspora margarita TaxID=4874 RepID=A0A8H4AJI1_GIGMA|nr:polyketide synthase [Gigaspora margarita]
MIQQNYIRRSVSKFQENLWTEYRSHPKSHNYNIISFLNIKNTNAIREITAAANILTARHGLLRSTFHDTEDNGKSTNPYRKEYPADHERIAVQVMEISVTEREKIMKKPFKLEKSYPIRFYLFMDPDGKSDNKICIISHFIAIDCAGNFNLIHEFQTLMAGKSLPTSKLTFDDYVMRHDDWLNSNINVNNVNVNNDQSELSQFWFNQIHSTKSIKWPTRRATTYCDLAPQPDACSYEVFHKKVKDLKSLAKAFGVTWYKAMFSAVWITMASFIDMKNVNLWIPFTGRCMQIGDDKNALSKLIGHCVNNMPVHLNVDTTNPINLNSFIHQVSTLLTDAKKNEMFPLINLSKYSQQTLKRQLIQQILVASTPKMPNGSRMRIFKSEIELIFDFVQHTDESIKLIIDYNPSIFDIADIKQISLQFLDVIKTMKGFMKGFNDLSFKIPKILMNNGSVPDISIPKFSTIHDLIQLQAKEFPDQLALNMTELNLSMTYSELNNKSNQIARYLTKIGVTTETFVIIHMNQDMYIIPWLLGVLKAGGAYVPVDKEYPAARKEFILRDSNAMFLITDDDDDTWYSNYPGQVIITTKINLSNQSIATLKPTCNSGNLCYMIYTSGTTGKPKGVLVEHQSVTTLLTDPRYDHFNRQGGGVRILQAFSFAFDASLMSWAIGLVRGATICFVKNPKLLIGNYLTDMIKLNEIEAIAVVPSALSTISPDDCGPTLKWVEVGGEVVSSNLIKTWKSKVQVFFNCYGPTEASIVATNYDIVAENNPVSFGSLIGTPRQHAEIYICDPVTHELVDGEGELCIGGICLARGYLNRDDLTKERFFYHPKLEKRIYRTGDRGRILEDGRVVFLGRIDRQTKLRGFRIELPEVETIMSSTCPEISLVSVQVNETRQTLVAFITPKNLDRDAVTAKLYKVMPKHQVPIIIPVDELPRTHNGKIDHSEVKKMMPTLLEKSSNSNSENSSNSNSENTKSNSENLKSNSENLKSNSENLKSNLKPQPPQPQKKATASGVLKNWSTIVAHLQTLWQELIGLKAKPDIDTTFFDLGGHSLLLVQLHKKIQKIPSAPQIDLMDLIQNPTIRSMANLLTPVETSTSETIQDNINEIINNNQNIDDDEIAVIAMTGFFPGAKSVDELWDLILTGKHGIHTFTDEELDDLHVPTNMRNDPSYVRRLGVLANIDKFDAPYFNITTKEAMSMCPQQRLLLELSVQALDEAGIDPEKEKGRIGVFAGVVDSTYNNTSMDYAKLDPAIRHRNILGVSIGSVATRVSYHLNLTGPSYSVNSTCSSSSTALKTALNSLKCGDCDVAIVAGACILLPQTGYLYQPGFIYSNDGMCRAFDHLSDGTVTGNSVTALVLKKMSSAIRDRNPISAILKSVAFNNDGSNKLSFMSPSVDGQCDAIKKAIQAANISPTDICVIEAHGTATRIGDQMEIKGLTKAFNELTPSTQRKTQYCAVSSVKTNIGHCNIASGITGVIKAVKSLENRVIAPMAHGLFEKPNPLIDFPSTPFYVATELQKYEDSKPMYIGVSCFGVGGTNGHCILAEYKQERFAQDDTTFKNSRVILPFSGKNSDALNRVKESYIKYFENGKFTLQGLHDTARTLQLGRTEHGFRGIVVASSISEAITQLKLAKAPVRAKATRCNVFVAPGQGSHSISTHRHLYKSSPLYQKRFKDCLKILQFYDPSVPDLTLYLTTNIHDSIYDPLLVFISSYILAEIIQSSLKLPISGAVGHSLGQYVAATIAGIFSLELALAIVLERTKIMHKMEKGLMLAANLTREEALKYVSKGKISLAASNEPEQQVFSGRPKDIEELANMLKEQNYKCKSLNASYGFHSHLADSILDEFESKISPLLEEAALNKDTITGVPFISNATGQWADINEVYTAKFWSVHLRETVLFEAGISTICSSFVNPAFIEIGIGAVTSRLIQRMTNNKEIAIKGFDSEQTSIEEMIGNCWANGVEINWIKFYESIAPAMINTQLVKLPSYPFKRKSYWIDQFKQSNHRFMVQNNYQDPNEADQEDDDEIDENAVDKKDLTIEDRVVLCFKKVLDQEEVYPDNSFYELGGDSLLGLSLLAALKREFGIHLATPSIIVTYPTPNTMAKFIQENMNNESSQPTLVTLNPGDKEFKNSIYVIHPIGGSCAIYKDMASSFGKMPVYGFEYPGISSSNMKYLSVQELAQVYLKELLKANPNGPYNLLGSSFGGVVAYEMASELIKQGKSVTSLTLVDSPNSKFMPKSLTNTAEILDYMFSETYELDGLLGLDDEKALKLVVAKASKSSSKGSSISSDMLKTFVDVAKLNLRALKEYELPIPKKPMNALFFKAMIKREEYDATSPENAWKEVLDGCGGRFECIELEGTHNGLNRSPICERISHLVRQRLFSRRVF